MVIPYYIIMVISIILHFYWLLSIQDSNIIFFFVYILFTFFIHITVAPNHFWRIIATASFFLMLGVGSSFWWTYPTKVSSNSLEHPLESHSNPIKNQVLWVLWVLSHSNPMKNPILKSYESYEIPLRTSNEWHRFPCFAKVKVALLLKRWRRWRCRDFTGSFFWDLKGIWIGFKGIYWDLEGIYWDFKGIYWDFKGIYWDFKGIYWDFKGIW